MSSDGQYTDQVTLHVHVQRGMVLPDGDWVLTVQPHGDFDRATFIREVQTWMESIEGPAGLGISEHEYSAGASGAVLNLIVNVVAEEAVSAALASLVAIGARAADGLRNRVPVEPLHEEAAIRLCKRELAHRYDVSASDLTLRSVELTGHDSATGEFTGSDGTQYLSELALVKGAVLLRRSKRTLP